QVKAELQVIPPRAARAWQIDLGFEKNFLRNKPLYLRVKFNAAQKSPSGTFIGVWQAGVPQTAQAWQSQPMSLSPDTYHQFQIPANLFDKNGVLTVVFLNANDTSLLFPLEDGIEVLYPKGGFALNYARGLGIIFCWLALFACLGLASASFLSFPVAAFFSLALLFVGLSSGTMASAVSQGTLMNLEPGTSHVGLSILNAVTLPVFRGLLTLINMVKDFSPVDALSSGRSIPWSELGRAFGQIVLLFGGLISLIGITIFNRRELATAQGNQ
ncbi:MAG TPA: hypothetical protein VKA67_02375, partial [Verrucomicrobiae bacterium]|nr:hypothetical protein [Verrucomicrobiae bacterium]